jgi:DNA topoisomerase-1
LATGKPVDLPPESEEVAGFYAAMLETDHAKDSTFQANFMKGFLETLAEHPPRNKITIGKNDFDKLDFRPMYEHFETEREKKKSMTKAEKAEAKKEKDAIEKSFITCLVDGRVEKVGNFRLEPPGLFRGRGEHPKKGTLKVGFLIPSVHSLDTQAKCACYHQLRLHAEDITINIGKEAKVPEPPAGHKWAKVQHDPNVTWLATWKENINGGTKYVFLAAGSAWKGQSDLKKFEKARKLKVCYTSCLAGSSFI